MSDFKCIAIVVLIVLRFCIYAALLKIRAIADAATLEEGVELKQIKIKEEYYTWNKEYLNHDFIFVYDYSKIQELGKTWAYFNKTFSNISAAKQRLGATVKAKWKIWNLNFDMASIYGEFRLFCCLLPHISKVFSVRAVLRT